MLLEKKVSNPLRKQQIRDEGGYMPPSPENRRTKIDGTYRKVYENLGVQVFLDRLVEGDFSPMSYNMRMIRFSVDALIRDTRDLMPFRKPKIIITDVANNPLVGNNNTNNQSGAFYRDRIIYIDEYSVDEPAYYIHEFAHFVADLIPKQTEPILEKAYKQMLDFYYKHAKVKKKQNLEPDEPENPISVNDAEKMREKIAKKLGFPAYGLMNFHEFFAVMIENWKQMPNNAVTYKYKRLVKSVLNRL